MHGLSRKHTEYGNVRDVLVRVSTHTQTSEIDGEFTSIVNLKWANDGQRQRR